MELYKEILCHVLVNEKVQVSFSELVDTDVTKIVELECYKVLHKIKTILEAKDRKAAGPTAPAGGLYLSKVEY